MRIAFVVQEFPSISETFVLNQITGLIDRGHEVEILAVQPGSGDTAIPEVATYGLGDRTWYRRMPANRVTRVLRGLGRMGVCGRRRPAATLRSVNVFRFGVDAASLSLLYAGAAIADRPRFDVIQAHFGPNGQFALAMRDAGLIDGRLVTTFHGFDVTTLIRQRGPRQYDRLFARGDLFLPVSDLFRNRLIELGADPARTGVHHMGVDCARFPGVDRSEHPGPVRVVTIARLVEKKGVEYAVRAVAELAARGRQVEYTIIGDGELRGRIESLADELNVGDRVSVTGWQSQATIVERLGSADILLAPSVTSTDGDMEGIPVVLMEGMAMQLPVVATRHSGLPELIEDGVTGHLAPERDADTLAERLQELVDDADQRTAMGRAGRAKVEREFNIDRLNDRLVERFAELERSGP